MVGKFEMKGLITWAETVFHDAGVVSTDEQVREMAATAASLIMTTRYLPFAAEHAVPEFVSDVRSHPMTDEGVESFDETRKCLLHMTTMIDLARSGEDKGMYNPYYDRVLKLVEAMDSDFKEVQRPIWAEDVRREFGPPAAVATAPAKKRWLAR